MDRNPAPPQDGLARILFMFAWPAAWYTLVIYALVEAFLRDGERVPTWMFMLVIVLGAGAELVAGLLLLRKEGVRWRDGSWRERLNWRWPRGRRAWILAVVVLLVALTLSMAAGPVNAALADVHGFTPPNWWPIASDPRAEISGAADVFPDVQLEGNVSFAALYLGITLLFNIVGEEVYYRGYLLPRMRRTFGRWDWVANGVLFTLKHVYQRWLFPGILFGGLAFAFAAGPLGSLPLAMLYHWIGNFLLQAVLLVMTVLGIG